jgi:hypothetical protein
LSAIKKFFPTNRLAIALKAAAPRSVQSCLNEAASNLKAIAGECMAHVEQQVALLERLNREWPEAVGEDFAKRLYETAARIIGTADVAGLPKLDQAARSLCDVIDGLWTRNAWEREPVAVHIDAMRLMAMMKKSGPEADAILAGLLGVRRKYALPPPPSKPAAKKSAV